MPWQQVEVALKEKRHELCMSGRDINKSLEESGFDTDLFKITSLNYLTIHDTILDNIPQGVSTLQNLQTLSLYSNKITTVDACLEKLEKLKVLDLSRNLISQVTLNFGALENLTTIIFTNNKLEQFPAIEKNAKLQVVNLSNNLLKEFPNICHSELASLCDLNLHNNQIQDIPDSIEQLVSLKNFDISTNKIAVIPGALINCTKLKELNLKENPVKDRRLFKLIEQCRTKQVLDYIKQHTVGEAPAGKKKNKKSAKGRTISEASSEQLDDKPKLTVKYATDKSLKVLFKEEVKAVRPNLVCCIVHGVEFTPELFKKFIQIQNKLHEDICEKRNAATIATHDANKVTCDLVYTAMKPTEFMIQPLNRQQQMTGEQLFQKLQTEADNLRKEKKRNVYSGIHKYLYLLEGKPLYPCLMKSADNAVISFPPITNSEISKMSIETKSLFLEVTSNASAQLARKIMDVLILQMMLLLNTDLVVEQTKIVDVDGNLRSVYPSKADLIYDKSCNITIVRD